MHNVLISGAGIAGPTLAWWLSKTGSKVTVVEKASSLLSIGQNVDVHGSALQVLRKMDLFEDVKRLNTTEKGTQLVNAKGGIVASFPVGEGASPTSQFEVLRGDLSKLLYEASKDLKNVEYRFSTTIEEVLSNDQDSVKVKFSNGEVESFDILVAADGTWSKVRKMCFPSDAVEVKDFGMVASYWTAPRTSADNDMWNILIALGRRVIAIRPDPYGTARVMITRMPENEAAKELWRKTARQDKDTQKQLLKKEFAGLGWETPRLLDSLDAADDFYFQAIQQIRMKKWSTGRVICLGDAAFSPTPLTAMGTSLAITGSYLLAQELNKLKDGEAPSVAFDEYERIFKPFVQDIQKVPSIFPGVIHPTNSIQRWFLWRTLSLVSVIVKIVSSISWFKGSLSNEEDIDFPLPDYDGQEKLKVEGKKKV